MKTLNQFISESVGNINRTVLEEGVYGSGTSEEEEEKPKERNFQLNKQDLQDLVTRQYVWKTRSYNEIAS